MSKLISAEDLIHIQKKLGDIGFFMASDDEFYKEYIIGGKRTRLAINLVAVNGEKTFRLASVKIGQVVVPIVQGKTRFDKVPNECIDDVMTVVASLAADEALMPKDEVYIYSAVCSKCSELSNSFFKLDNDTICIKCL